MPVDEARSPEITKYTATEIATAVNDGEARPPGNAKYMVTAKSQLAESPGELHDEAGPSWPSANGTSSVASSTAATHVDEARLPKFTEYCATEDTDDSEEWDESEEEKYFCSLTRAVEENWAARIIQRGWRWTRKRMWIWAAWDERSEATRCGGCTSGSQR